MDGDVHEIIRKVLKNFNKPISITQIAREAKISRATAARYLDHLLFSGQVKLFEIGNAKKYLLSSEPVHHLCDFSSNLIIIINSSFRILYVNKAYLEFSHISFKETLGKRIDSLNLDIFASINIITLLEKNTGNDLTTHIIEVYRENRLYIYEMIIIKGNTASYRAAISIVIKDISVQKRIEDENRFLASIVACSEDAIIAVDDTLSITAWNSGAERLFGYRYDEALGQKISLIHQSCYHDVYPIHERLLDGESIKQYECTRKRKNGSLVEVSITASLVFDKSGVIIGSSAIFRDVSAQKQMIKTHSEINQRLHTLIENIDEVLAIIDPDTHTILLMNAFGKQLFGNNLKSCWFYENQYNESKVCEICSHIVQNRIEKKVPASFVFETKMGNFLSKIRAIPWENDKRVIMITMVDPNCSYSKNNLLSKREG